jgi:hypothetical protein
MEEIPKIAIYDIRIKKINFSFDWLKLQEGIKIKFIQVYYNEEPFIRCGPLMHRHILEEFLKEIKINFKNRENSEGYKIPLEEDSELKYKAVGTGLIKIRDNQIKLYGDSFDYKLGIDKKHLEDVFGNNNVLEKETFDKPCFLIDFHGD